MKSKIYNFRNGEILLVDKPLEWTSFDVVNKLRYPLKKRYNIKRFKVGHAGTLDPLATGLLVICTGKKTKEISNFITDIKEYTGIIKLGATTPSYDLETSINKTFSTKHITQELINKIKPNFIGNIEQIPPIFSAKKIDGKRAYTIARKGGEIKLKPNNITIFDLNLELKPNNEIHFHVRSSKGTYIRTLAHDIGKAISSGGHLIKLRRVKSGEFDIKNAHSIEFWQHKIENCEINDLI